ncbi:MAG: DUF58 domain-containing protein, partial [Pseudomonadales bacterium]|nr:DUF58 domain-containing protein [Pseudomonadales bacterium]
MASNAQAPNARLWRSPRFRKWLDRRMPPANSIVLDQKKIFILPTREGLYFMLLVLLMMLAATNYQNSLVFALAFMLVSLFVVSIFHTYRNLAGLCIEAGSTRPAFATEDAEFSVVLKRHGARTYEALMVGWDPELLQGADLLEDEEVKLRLFVKTDKRGIMNPGRLLIQTWYPVGLFRAWSWVDLGMTTLVYPKPVRGGEIPTGSTTTNEGELVQREGSDDFYGLRDYQDSDPLRHVAWKSYARTGDMLTKQYAAFVDRRVWLDWDNFQALA